jgi:hypothetical protein
VGKKLRAGFSDPEGAVLHSHDWNLPQPADRAEAHAGVLFLICTSEARAYDLGSGAHLGSIRVSRRSSHGRYFLTRGMLVHPRVGRADRETRKRIPSKLCPV